MDLLLGIAGKKLGADPAKLKSQLEQGTFDDALKGMNPTQAAQLNRVLSNPKVMEQMLNTPQVKEMLKKLMG